MNGLGELADLGERQRNLGLHIVETIVTQDGGYVRAANRSDAQGAEFTITLPFSPQAIPARAS